MAQNFVHGVPQFCVSITVQHKGVSPTWSTWSVRDEMFSASRGKGAPWLSAVCSERTQTLDGGLFGA
jgi:myo-inositol-1(or 4)-monophosphatase